jgi:type VI secretion system protein ImpH
MQTTQRHHDLAVIDQLVDAPYRFEFVQAVKLVLRRLRAHGIGHDEAFRHILRFQNSLSLSFPASEIESITVSGVPPADAEGAPALWRGMAPRRVTLTPAFIGLLGVQGVLPLHHSERFASLQPRATDASARAFLDMFSNRMVALFFEAWGKYRVEHRLDTTGRDTLLPMLRALGGATPMPTTATAPDAEVAAYYAGLLRTRPISACAVARILSEYFAVPVAMEEFIGCWDVLPASHRSTLGGASARLGYGFTLGVRMWRNDLRVRLRIGPLEQAAFDGFLPGGAAARALEKLLGMLAMPCMRFEARLILSRPCVRRLSLTTGGGARAQRLGWDTFVSTTADAVAAPEVRYMLRPAA